MIHVYGTFIPMEVLPPLHTSLINGYQFPISDMVPSLSGHELFAIKSYWLFILQQFNPYSYITGICCPINPEWLGVV